MNGCSWENVEFLVRMSRHRWVFIPRPSDSCWMLYHLSYRCQAFAIPLDLVYIFHLLINLAWKVSDIYIYIYYEKRKTILYNVRIRLLSADASISTSMKYHCGKIAVTLKFIYETLLKMSVKWQPAVVLYPSFTFAHNDIKIPASICTQSYTCIIYFSRDYVVANFKYAIFILWRMWNTLLQNLRENENTWLHFTFV